MTQVATWPSCTWPGCGHTRRHATETKAAKVAKANQRRYTTPGGHAICSCHHEAAPPEVELPRLRFRCDEGMAP
jgi:hypothetical protein